MNKVICGLLASFFLYSCATEDRPSYYRYEVRAGAALEPIISGNHENNKYNRLSDQLVSELGDNEASTSGWIASSLNGAFFYHLNRHVGVGLLGGKAFDVYHYENWDNWNFGSLRQTFTYVIPAIKYTWTDIPPGWVYSKVAVGAGRQHIWLSGWESKDEQWRDVVARYDVNRWQMAYQISPFCVEFGRRKVRYFLELGYGIEGFLNMGISFHFMNAGK
jgi:hypothetical protein